jgi:hypothetical protein
LEGIVKSKACLLKALYRGYCVAPDAVIGMAGTGASTASDWLKDWLYPILLKPHERILQSHDRDMQSLLKRFFKKRDEHMECAQRGEGAPAAIVCFLFELRPGFA